jgi:signal peptidase I
MFSAFIVGIVITQNTISRATVSGHSMDNTLKDGQTIWVNHLPFISYGRGDLAIVSERGTFLVKRVIATPGDTVQFVGDLLYVNGELVKESYVTDVNYDKGLLSKLVTLGESEYVVLGDNRDSSVDSRNFGAVNKKSLKGKVVGYGSKVRKDR